MRIKTSLKKSNPLEICVKIILLIKDDFDWTVSTAEETKFIKVTPPWRFEVLSGESVDASGTFLFPRPLPRVVEVCWDDGCVALFVVAAAAVFEFSCNSEREESFSYVAESPTNQQ